MARTSKTPGAILKRKQDKLKWDIFSFLENLLVFCAAPSRSVPKESGVHFQISSQIKDEGVCILFKIDRRADPLMPGAGLKPDYMTLYATRDRCICTIIEMKGRDEKNLKHGIEQIKALRQRLRHEIDEHLPGACRSRIKFQGILLTPVNAQVPNHLLAKEADAGLKIVALRYDHKAELYPYVREELSQSVRYVHQKLRRDADEFNFIESLLVHAALPERIQDALSSKRQTRGVHLHYAHPDGRDEDYAALIADKPGAQVATLEQSKALRKKIQGELIRLGLHYKALKFTSIPEPAP